MKKIEEMLRLLAHLTDDVLRFRLASPQQR